MFSRVLFSAVLLIFVCFFTVNTFADHSNGDPGSCQLNSAKGNITHVIYIQFDNTHFLRDNPNVPSDLEQMPNLLNFMKNNGTLLTNDHTGGQAKCFHNAGYT